MLKAKAIKRFVCQTCLAIFACHFWKNLRVVTLNNPLLPHAWETFLQVNLNVWVRERTAGVVDVNRSILFPVRNTVLVFCDSRCEVYLCHADFYVREDFSAHVRFLSLCVCLIVVYCHVISCFIVKNLDV